MTSVSIAEVPGISRIEAARFSRGTYFYILCLSSISAGYYVYWWLWKLKAYLVGWGFCLVMLLAMLLANHLRVGRLVRDMLPVIVWFGYLFASALWSPSPSTTLYFLGADLVNFAAFIVGYTWALSTSERALGGFFELQALMILPIILWFFLTIGQLYNAKLGAVRTGFATSCLISLPFIIWRLRRRTSFSGVLLLMIALSILLSGDSRSAVLITPVLVIGAFFFVGHARVPLSRRMAPLLAIVVMLGAGSVLVPTFRSGISQSIERLTSSGPVGTRLTISSTLLDEVKLPAEQRVDIERRLQLFVSAQSFLSHPLLGAGFQSTLAIIRNTVGWNVSAHGLPSTLLGETGLVGTTIFVWMIARFFRRINYAKSLTTNPQRADFYSTCKLTMLGILLLGLFHQVDQIPQTFVLLAWGYAGPSPPT